MKLLGLVSLRKYPCCLSFQTAKYQHPVDNCNNPQGDWICYFFHFFGKKFFGQI